VIQVARDLHLIFPSSSATAVTIRSMHLAAESASLARRKMKALSLAFVVAVILRVVSQYAISILWVRGVFFFHSVLVTYRSQDWHPFTWMFLCGTFSNAAITLEGWGWFLEWTLAFVGTGMLAGLNASLSYVLGTTLAWSAARFFLFDLRLTDIARAVINPYLVAQGLAFGTAASEDPRWSAFVSYLSLSKKFTSADHPSPRYWHL
jgi:uncharacterized oligopeptide transporter (OPT) family protein